MECQLCLEAADGSVGCQQGSSLCFGKFCNIHHVSLKRNISQ